MDEKTFATKCLEWYDLQQKADELAAELEAETIERGKTQNVGPVRVTFSNPRKSYDYEAAWNIYWDGPPPEMYGKWVWDYRNACKDQGIEVEGVAKGEPSAKIKIL